MKKFYCFVLALLSLLSCVVFSACGDKFKNLSISFFNEAGEDVFAVEFLIDTNEGGELFPTQKLGIEFEKIDEDDVGQILVYSEPYELVDVSNYKYDGNICYVDLKAKMSSGEGAKIVVTHLASGKKETIPLNIEQKANNLTLKQGSGYSEPLKYIVSIPEEDTNSHYVDMSKLINLLPAGSTDNVFFNLANDVSLSDGISLIKLTDMEGYEDLKGTGFDSVACGFDVKSTAEEKQIKIYPVTYLEEYDKNSEDIEKYKDKEIIVEFRKTLSSDKIRYEYKNNSGEYSVVASTLKLIVNDQTYNSIVLTPQVLSGTEFVNFLSTDYTNLYDIEISVEDSQRISALYDSTNGVIVVTANQQTINICDIIIILKPKNVVGEIDDVEKTISVEGISKPDYIQVRQDGDLVEDGAYVDIFNYYEDGNSLGSLFKFEAKALSGMSVDQSMKSIKLVVDYNILSLNNLKTVHASVEDYPNGAYALEFYAFGNLLEFDEIKTGESLYQSNEISADADIYIKYVNIAAGKEDRVLSMIVKTVNSLALDYVDTTTLNVERQVNFNTIEGVKEMKLQAGTVTTDGDKIDYAPIDFDNPETVYLNRQEIVKEGATAYYLHVKNDSVLDMFGQKIAENLDFEIKVQPLKENVENPLKIVKTLTLNEKKFDYKNESGSIILTHDNSKVDDGVILIVDKNTAVGKYEIVFSQAKIKRASIICEVYETIDKLTSQNIELEIKNSVIENPIIADPERKYKDYSLAEYIVPSGENLNVSIKVLQDVLDSNIVLDYIFDFDLILADGSSFTPAEGVKEDFFDVVAKQNNNAVLDFKKGTFIEQIVFVKVSLSLKVNTYVSIIEKGEAITLPTTYDIGFFIYDEISYSDVKLSDRELFKHPNELLGAYNKEHSQASLNLTMSANLWNYVTSAIEWELLNASNNSTCTPATDGRSCEFVFREKDDGSKYLAEIHAKFYQFGKTYQFKCDVYVEKPNITTEIVMDSAVNVTDEIEQKYYINLKEGEEYQVEAQNLSNLGEVTHKGFLIQVVDEFGVGFYTQEYFEIDQEKLTIKVKRIDENHNFKLIVFAKDALSKHLSAQDNLNNPENYLMVWDLLTNPNQFNKAYFVADLILSNGDAANPFLIKSEKDFWEIDDTEALKTKHYMLMTSLDLKGMQAPIEDFSGTLKTYNYNIYQISGIILNDKNVNLFKNIKEEGQINEILFVVEYAYDLNLVSESQNLGVIGENAGTLRNVGVVTSGKADLKTATTTQYNFGGLVGHNTKNGRLEYLSQITEGEGKELKVLATFGNINGTQGIIQNLSGNAKVFFGGLVGVNEGLITGAEKETESAENSIIFSTGMGRANALSLITINSNVYGTSAVGGLVGYNTGLIKNAYVQATIKSTQTSNVGGVIGQNKFEENSITINNVNSFIYLSESTLEKVWNNKLNGKIYNVKSASVVEGVNNVGGIVGADENGFYLDCDYQILSQTQKHTTLKGVQNVGGIAGYSKYGKFLYCSVMSYNWAYEMLKTDGKNMISADDIQDIVGEDYVGGVVGCAESSNGISIGNNEECGDRTVVAYSSVNAFIQSVGQVGGMLTSLTGAQPSKSVIVAVYFIGKLNGIYEEHKITTDKADGAVGTIEHHFALTNNANVAFFNMMYSINIKYIDFEYKLRIGRYIDGSEWIIDKTPEISYFGIDEKINGGYLFVSPQKTDGVPIFEVAPENIIVTPVDTSTNGVLVLDYYDFSIHAGITDKQLEQLNKVYNRKYVLDRVISGTSYQGILNIEVSPKKIGTVALNIKSTNSQILEVLLDGTILIKGIGECKLIFTSVLNSSVSAYVDVVVNYPIGTFNISSSPNDRSKITSTANPEKISKGSSRQYYVLTYGSADGFDFKTTNTTNLKVEITAVVDKEKSISDYLSITGVVESDEKNTSAMVEEVTFVVTVDASTPFMISVLERLDGVNFNFKVTPYEIIKNTNTNKTLPIAYSASADFALITTMGATKVSFSYDDALVYLNDTVTLNIFFETDTDLGTVSIIQGKINDAWQKSGVQLFNGILLMISSGESDTDFGSSNVAIVVEESEFNKELNSHRIKLRFDFVGLNSANFAKDPEKELKICCELEYGNTAQVNYTILAQRINKIEVKNYYKDKTDDEEMVLGDVLKAETPGKIIIDMVPNNAHYTYLEISDITGSDEILFIQLDANGNALSVNSDLSSDKKGIKLYPDATNVTGRIVVKTQIDNTYTSKMHLIEIRAYYSSTNGDVLLNSTRKEIDVKMLPKVKVQYVLPNGSDSVFAENSQTQSIFLAKGASAHLKITTQNTTQDFEYSLAGPLKDKFSLVHTTGMHYELQPKTTDLVKGQSVMLTVNAYAYMGLGSYEMATCSIEFIITNFVIHSVSVNQSLNNVENPEIYGYFDKEIKLNFYFDRTDISFFDETTSNDPINDTVYSYVKDIEMSTHGDLQQIYLILKELNATSNYISLVKEKGTVSDDDKVELSNNTLTVEQGYNKDVKLKISFKLKNISNVANSPNWQIEKSDAEIEKEIQQYQMNKQYRLNFRSATDWYEPTAVNSLNDFKEMVSGGRYILNTDLTGEQALKDYSPLDLDLVEFDGNGRTIEIQSFATFTDQEIKAGLFKQVYENMIVKNVVLKYSTQENSGNYTLGKADASSGKIEYFNLCNSDEVAYSSAKFGGIAAINNGIITNCQVEGEIAVRARTLEESSGGGQYSVNLFLGGMVAENSYSGYITNSTSTLSIYAQANVGGFAYSNSGKIVSCAVKEGETDRRTTFYGYNSDLSNTIVVEMAGFVVSNSGDISMSYVNLTAEGAKNNAITLGTMSAKDISAGFVYTNGGTISDAYVQISQTGANNNTFAGFAYRSSGTIKKSYTFINNGVKQDKNDAMFAPAGTKGIENCLEFATSQSGYNNGNEGLTTLDSGHRFNQNSYEKVGFVFGSNETGAVWVMEPGKLPELVSTLEEVKAKTNKGLITLKEIPDTDFTDGTNDVTYKADFSSYGTKENPYIITSLEDWNNYFNEKLNLLMNGYYRIVKDIDFSKVGGNPQTSKTVFKGNIQGNNMTLDGIMLYSKEALSSIGLFKALESAGDANIENSVRNLTIKTTSVWASSTSAVGVLAGVAEDFNLYNITIDASNVIMVGKNAVGGLAGVIRGNGDVDQISSNIGANSTRASILRNYAVYVSKTNGLNGTNLNKVYYAGSVAGIVDLFNYNSFKVNDPRDITNHYFKVQNIDVSSDSMVLAGDTVGVAFGFIGERVMLKNARVNITGEINGSQYSAGLVGENRGAIINAVVNIPEDVFGKAKYALGGAVGLNFGGLVKDVAVKAVANMSEYAFTAGGIVARNVYGTIANCHFDGEINAYYTGGIVGANYSSKILREASIGNGAIDSDCKIYSNLFPSAQVKYYEQAKEIKNFSDVSISLEAFNKMLENSSRYYSYENPAKGEADYLGEITVEGKVLGIVAGLSYEEFDEFGKNLATVVEKDGETFKVKTESGKLIFNKSNEATWSTAYHEKSVENVLLKDGQDVQNQVKFTFEKVNVLTMKIVPSRVMYLVGAKASALNSWTMEYSSEYILVM